MSLIQQMIDKGYDASDIDLFLCIHDINTRVYIGSPHVLSQEAQDERLREFSEKERKKWKQAEIEMDFTNFKK